MRREVQPSRFSRLHNDLYVVPQSDQERYQSLVQELFFSAFFTSLQAALTDGGVRRIEVVGRYRN